jgi:hypothetical protein
MSSTKSAGRAPRSTTSVCGGSSLTRVGLRIRSDSIAIAVAPVE